MYIVSNDYKSQINKPTRNISYLKVNFGIVNDNATNNNTIIDNGHLFYSNLPQLADGYNVEKRYLTLEHNKFILDGNNLLPPEDGSITPYFQGYVSTSISNSLGVFTTPPTLTIDFPVPYAFFGLTFRFNKMFNNYPTEFQITAFNGATQVYTSTEHPTGYDFILDKPVPASGLFCNKLVLKFNKTFPVRRRAELEYLMFGVVASFSDADITQSTWTREVDLISTRLPKNEFEFTILDPMKNYNPENPTGIWQYLEERQPVWFQYGYELDNGSIEWVNGSNLFSNGKVKVDSKNLLSSVTFTSESILNTLEEDYYRGVYNPNGISLYDLALDVLEFANLPLLLNGLIPYVIDNSLKTIFTKVPLPEMKVKEVLQLIANAGLCVINCNRLGQIEISKMNSSLSDFKFDFKNTMNAPILEKIPFLLSVETFSNTITISSESTQIHNSTVSLTEPTECLLQYDMSTDVVLGVGTGVTVIGTPIYYAGSCLVTLNGSGTVNINGRKLVFSKDGISYKVGETGFTCNIENQILNSQTDAYNYAQWIASILKRRNQYKVEDRGYPEVDLGDLILTDTLFTLDMQSTIVSSKIKFNGALSSETTYLSKEVT